MAARKDPKAAIDVDEALDQPLNKLSAAEFIQVLGHRDFVNTGVAQILPDKKKYELWVEPEDGIFNVPLRDILERLRTEKKKAEYEFPPGGHWREQINPARLNDFNYDRLIEDIASRVEERLGRH